jgi:hypothetical protein
MREREELFSVRKAHRFSDEHIGQRRERRAESKLRLSRLLVELENSLSSKLERHSRDVQLNLA